MWGTIFFLLIAQVALGKFFMSFNEFDFVCDFFEFVTREPGTVILVTP